VADPPASSIEAQLAEFRARRRALEEAILPLAGSVDGRRFTLQASLFDLAFEAGGYVAIESESGDTRLGLVVSVDAVEAPGPQLALGDGGTMTIQLRAARCAGTVLDGDGKPFHDALARPAKPEEVAEHLSAVAPRGARLAVGELMLSPGVRLELDASGFDRHSFLCGQSGSGKTYALGVVLERLLHETDLRMIVLDPNSDFVRLGETVAGADEALAERHRAVGPAVAVRRAGSDGDDRLALRVRDLDAAAQAAALRLDPVGDREEYATLAALAQDGRPETLEDIGDEDLALRIRNLGVDEWALWARGEGPSIVAEALEGDARCLVCDLGSLATREEQALTSTAVLSALWRERERRQPVLIVIDEAHNVCPAEPQDALTALSTELAVRIAAEGRKFGLYLLVSTQRPQKVAENVLAQCDNLFLMRMNSQADLGHVADVFSFVPAGLLGRATTFRQGECLVAGKIAPHPTLMRVGARVSVQGGGDVPADWAAAR
jgi:hypothetical protein